MKYTTLFARLLILFSFVSVDALSEDRSDENFNLQQSRKNMKQIALALHNYHEEFGTLPGFANFDHNRNPLLSWRVHILPFLGKEAKELHAKFRFNEPWYSDHNEKLVSEIPDVYKVPLQKPLKPGETTYFVPVSEGSLFPPNRNGNTQVAFKDVYQGLPNILMIVEADRSEAGAWSAPFDLEFDGRHPLMNLGTLRDGGFLGAWAMGTVSWIPNSFASERTDHTEFLRGLFERTGNRGVAYYFNLK